MKLEQFITKLQNKTAELSPDSPNLKSAFVQIGLMVVATAKLEARRQRIGDTGRLINSIRYELFTHSAALAVATTSGGAGSKSGYITGVNIGPFGTHYAKYHEYGADLPPNAVRAMFAAMRQRSQFRPQVAGKGVFTGNAKTGGHLKARPFMRPALVKNQKFIIDTLRAAVGFSK
jgi:hypothetical protein